MTSRVWRGPPLPQRRRIRATFNGKKAPYSSAPGTSSETMPAPETWPEARLDSVPPGVKFDHSIQRETPRLTIARSQFCIYCGSTSASSANQKPLSEEHIIPEGLGGKLIFDHASCDKCAAMINVFESELLSTILFAPRRILGIKGKSRRRVVKKREQLYKYNIVEDDKYQGVSLPLDAHPSLLLLPVLSSPSILRPRVEWRVRSVVDVYVPTKPYALESGRLTQYGVSGYGYYAFLPIASKNCL
jgi:HNH endonuclease